MTIASGNYVFSDKYGDGLVVAVVDKNAHVCFGRDNLKTFLATKLSPLRTPPDDAGYLLSCALSGPESDLRIQLLRSFANRFEGALREAFLRAEKRTVPCTKCGLELNDRKSKFLGAGPCCRQSADVPDEVDRWSRYLVR